MINRTQVLEKEAADINALSSELKTLASQVESQSSQFSTSDSNALFYSFKKMTVEEESKHASQLLGFREHDRDRVAFKMRPEQMRIGDTHGGEWLQDATSHLTRKDVKVLWAKASRHYAENAAGDIQAVVMKPPENSIWKQVELPILLENGNVKKINGVARDKLLNHGKNYGLDAVQEVIQNRVVTGPGIKYGSEITSGELQRAEQQAEERRIKKMQEPNRSQKSLDSTSHSR